MELICSRVQLDAGMASARLAELTADSSFFYVVVWQCFQSLAGVIRTPNVT